MLNRLGQYTALIVRPLNMRPVAATLISASARRIEVRISSSTAHIVLVIAPESDMAGEVFFLRALAPHNLSIPRLIAHDLNCLTVPFSYAIENHVGGVLLSSLEDEPLIRIAARQIGRTLRRVHQLAAPGFGHPTLTGRWPARSWQAALSLWLERMDVPAQVTEVLGPETSAALWAATRDHPDLRYDRPMVIHGAVGPANALVSVGDGVHLEALIQPGILVGGDPLFDLAYGLLPEYPAAFRQGLVEGYTVIGPLGPDQLRRLQRLKFLVRVVEIIRRAEPSQRAELPDLVIPALSALKR